MNINETELRDVVNEAWNPFAPKYNGYNLKREGTTVSFDVEHTKHQGERTHVVFSIHHADDEGSLNGHDYYYKVSKNTHTKEDGGTEIEYVVVDIADRKIEINFKAHAFSSWSQRNWDVVFSNESDKAQLEEIIELVSKYRGDVIDEKPKGGVGNGGTGGGEIVVPGMPSNFGRNPENVKIAQRFLVYNNADISTTKSADGVDGILGRRTKKAILAYMTEKKCDFAKFWKDAQEHSRTAQNAENLKKQNMETQMQSTQNNHLSSQGDEQAAQQSAYDYTKSSAYGKYLGGATPEEIQKFQYDFKVQPTGKYDEATAEKAYALANDEADNSFKRAGSTIKDYANYDLHQSGYASGQADLRAQQAREALVAQVEKLKKRLAPFDDRKLDQIISYVDSGNFAAATELAKRVSGGGHTIQPLIAALEAARKPAMNEIKKKFFETLNRINNATILM